MKVTSNFRDDLAESSTREAAGPFTRTAIKGHASINASGGCSAFGAVHNVSIPAGRFKFKKCSPVLLKLLSFAIGRKFIFKSHNFFRQLGFFFLGFSCDLLNELYLLIDKSDALPQDGGTLND